MAKCQDCGERGSSGGGGGKNDQLRFRHVINRRRNNNENKHRLTIYTTNHELLIRLLSSRLCLAYSCRTIYLHHPLSRPYALVGLSVTTAPTTAPKPAAAAAAAATSAGHHQLLPPLIRTAMYSVIERVCG